MSTFGVWLTVLFGWVVISIFAGLVVGRILHLMGQAEVLEPHLLDALQSQAGGGWRFGRPRGMRPRGFGRI
jgi:hypothetical protein